MIWASSPVSISIRSCRPYSGMYRKMYREMSSTSREESERESERERERGLTTPQKPDLAAPSPGCAHCVSCPSHTQSEPQCLQPPTAWTHMAAFVPRSDSDTPVHQIPGSGTHHPTLMKSYSAGHSFWECFGFSPSVPTVENCGRTPQTLLCVCVCVCVYMCMCVALCYMHAYIIYV